MAKEFTAAVLWTRDDGTDADDAMDFDTESEARAWLADAMCHETQTKEIWRGRHQVEV